MVIKLKCLLCGSNELADLFFPFYTNEKGITYHCGLKDPHRSKLEGHRPELLVCENCGLVFDYNIAIKKQERDALENDVT